ncbi:hypothetical protein EXS57_00945 [Candidatus Kaiserbacteria bacterium]|nr:hypothetical protein [Candidatus Kaiserbacteria bacterium]
MKARTRSLAEMCRRRIEKRTEVEFGILPFEMMSNSESEMRHPAKLLPLVCRFEAIPAGLSENSNYMLKFRQSGADAGSHRN